MNCRYNETNKREIMDSRVKSTRIIGEAIQKIEKPPSVWLQASTAAIYPHTLGRANGEDAAIDADQPGSPATWRFSIDVAKAWEKAAIDAITPGTRKVLLRSAMTMSPDKGGIFDTLLDLCMARALHGASAAHQDCFTIATAD